MAGRSLKLGPPFLFLAFVRSDSRLVSDLPNYNALKSSGASPNFLSTCGSSNVREDKSPLRLNAMAPATPSRRDRYSARSVLRTYPHT
jgi:hypothetical protein